MSVLKTQDFKELTLSAKLTHPPPPPPRCRRNEQKGHILVLGHLEVLLAHHLHVNYPLFAHHT